MLCKSVLELVLGISSNNLPSAEVEHLQALVRSEGNHDSLHAFVRKLVVLNNKLLNLGLIQRFHDITDTFVSQFVVRDIQRLNVALKRVLADYFTKLVRMGVAQAYG